MVNATSNGKEYDTSIHEITYDHINNEYFGEAAQIHAISFELLKPNDLKVGYIESGFDEVADYLSYVGFYITKLTEEVLNNGEDRKSRRLNSSHVASSYAVFCL